MRRWRIDTVDSHPLFAVCNTAAKKRRVMDQLGCLVALARLSKADLNYKFDLKFEIQVSQRPNKNER